MAPILRHSKELWGTRVRTFSFALPWQDFGSSSEAVSLSPGPGNWKQATGPTSPMKLSLSRIGWAMPTFTAMRDQLGVDLPLALVSPALLKQHLGLAVLHLSAVL
eukprot:471560-Pyramimonas_sp.AAC.1